MSDRIGQKLGNYTIVQFLGRGAFADVYLAEHVYLKTQVAVKVLQTRLSLGEDTNSFLQEAQTIARLSHPHIVRVIDFGLDGETPFLVMDYAPNGTLRQRHPKGTQLPLALVISYIQQLADALDYAHEEKVIHRDIKPENMLFGKRHDVLLSDFGVALIAQSSRYQGAQEVAGTVSYMAPEQIQGKARTASDQYSLGVIVYEWISGTRPFHGSFTEVCTQHLFAPVPPLNEKVPDVLPQVEHVISIALSKDPKQRFANIHAFARALEQASQSTAPTIITSRPDVSPVVVLAQSSPQTQLEEVVQPAPILLEPEAPPTPSLPATSLGETPLSPTSSQQAEPSVPMLHQQASAPISAPVQASPWRIGSQQIVAMIVGIGLFGIVSYCLDLFFVAANNDGFSSPPYSSFWYLGSISFSLLNVVVGLSLIVPAFFAARFGPWVGLVSAVCGNLLGNALSGTLNASFNPWYTNVTYAIFGFIAGLAFIRTRGHYNTRADLLPLFAFPSIALIIGFVWQSMQDRINNATPPITSFYLPITLVFCLPGLLLLFGFLSLYKRETTRKS